MAESGGRAWKFSLSTMLMVVTIACLATALVLTSRRLAETESLLGSMKPLPLKEIAAQFEKKTTLGPIATKVTDVRYSPEADAYKVQFSWTNKDTDETWTSDVILKSGDYGAYVGRIRNGPFATPLGYTDGYPVAVRTPSAFKP